MVWGGRCLPTVVISDGFLLDDDGFQPTGQDAAFLQMFEMFDVPQVEFVDIGSRGIGGGERC